MPHHSKHLTAAFGLLLALPFPLSATGSCQLSGSVKGPDGAALAGVSITLLPSGDQATTDGGGRFCLPTAPPGRHRLVAVADGYRIEEVAVRLEDDTPRTFEIRLGPAFGEEVVVTPTRTEQRLADVPVHLEVIGREAIESTASRTLADIVEWAPGIRVESNCQNCNEAKIRLLGLEGPYSQLLIDGQPTVSSLALVYGIEQLPARLIDSVEVVKGAGSALYGAGAVAGVLNLIPHQASHPHVVAEASFGETGGEPSHSVSAVADWASADRTWLVTGFLQTDRADAVDVDGDGFSDVTERELDTFGLRADLYVRDSRGRLTAEVNRIDAYRRGGDSLDLPPHEALIAEALDTARLGASLRWLHAPSNAWDYRLVASWSRTDRDSYYGVGRDPNAYGTTENPLAVFDVQLNRATAAGTWTGGAQWQRDEVLDVQPGYGRHIEETFENVGVFVQREWTFAREWTLLAGTRFDEHSAVADPIASPRLALLWSPRADLSVRGSLGRGFRAPAVFDEDLHIALLGGGQAQLIRNDPDLEEETSTSALVGVEWRPTFFGKGAAAFGADLFRTDLDGLFHLREADDPATDELEFVRENFGGARVEGLELTASVRWGAGLTLDLGWVEQTARFDSPEPDFGSRDFFRTPEQYGTASLRARLPASLDLFLGLRYTGPMKAPHYAGFVATDRLETTSSFLTADVHLARTFTPRDAGHPLTWTVGVRNVGDAFQEDLDRGPDRDASYVYGPRFPRQVFTSLKVDW